jgi:hypothetical protein
MKVGRGTEIEFYKRTNSPENKTIPAHILEFFPKFYGLNDSLVRSTFYSCRFQTSICLVNSEIRHFRLLIFSFFESSICRLY